jgi:Ran GTPase-activating protein (RanGAP) involved in mRNA processing and transport
LAQALQINSTLTTLDLYDNEIGDEGAKHLAQTLQINRTLTTLHLYSNQIGAEGAEHLAEALQVNTTLTMLTIWWNEIDDAMGYDLFHEINCFGKRVFYERKDGRLHLMFALAQ